MRTPIAPRRSAEAALTCTSHQSCMNQQQTDASLTVGRLVGVRHVHIAPPPCEGGCSTPDQPRRRCMLCASHPCRPRPYSYRSAVGHISRPHRVAAGGMGRSPLHQRPPLTGYARRLALVASWTYVESRLAESERARVSSTQVVCTNPTPIMYHCGAFSTRSCKRGVEMGGGGRWRDAVAGSALDDDPELQCASRALAVGLWEGPSHGASFGPIPGRTGHDFTSDRRRPRKTEGCAPTFKILRGVRRRPVRDAARR